MQSLHRPKLQPAVNDGDHRQGPDDAPVTLVEYGDYQCPYCGQAHPIVRALQQRLGKRLRLVFRNFPLSEIHPHALHAAEAAESVNAHAGAAAFWEMHHTLFTHQQALDDSQLGHYAKAAGGDATLTVADVAAGAFEDKVRADFMSGVHSGVNGTPTFFINGARFEGNWTDIEEFAAALEAAGA
ncbi:MAG TPA: thioredoxin domain-containing protein [Gemmatimonadales bacterium]|jgi:protein-disulfide isomerase|nr:thioredoxin domain-containing protein [Gemmatimonadales bacterium]